MPSQMIIWTALPNGSTGSGAARRLKLSVFVVPRLRATAAEGDTLKLFPDWLDWTARMAQTSTTLKVQFAGGPTLDANVDRSKLDPALWRALFNGDTFVRTHTFDNYAGRTIIAYPARRVYDELKDTYQANGRVIEWDEIVGEDGPPRLFKWRVDWNAATEADARGKLNQSDLTGQDLTARVLLFHRRPEENPVQLPQNGAGHTRTLDFHQALSALGDYPDLLRRLGLVLDLDVPAAGVPTTVTAVQVIPTFTPAPGTVTRLNRTPKTAVLLDATRFQAASNTDEIIDGMLALNEGQYDLIPVDLDGATLKLVHTANTIDGPAAPFYIEDNIFGDGPPALRSAGIALTRREEAAATKAVFSRALANNAAIEAAGDVTLFADDLVRGLCIDIFDAQADAWRSLCRRVGAYVFESINRTLTVEDEGFVQPALGEAANPKPGAPNDLYLTEALARWEGWSLVAPRPGRTGSTDGGAAPEEQDNAALTAFKLRVSFTAARGSLPTLRFGKRYRMRARVVDLAGNSVGLEAAPEAGLPSGPRPFAYLRYEPVPSPAIVLRTPINPKNANGESLERIVIRTANTDPSKDIAPSAALAERHLAPPRAAEPFAESHGVVDGPAGAPRADLYAVLKAKDAGEFPLDPTGGMPLDGGAQLALPYLPDPLSRGPALRGLPGMSPSSVGRIDPAGSLVFTEESFSSNSSTAVLLDWGQKPAWPNLQPLRLILREGDGPPKWDHARRVLTVSLPKGKIVRVPLSSYLNEEDLKLMGVWDWLRERTEDEIEHIFEVSGSDAAELREEFRRLRDLTLHAITGGHAMLTPSRRLELVHAVQQPLGRPAWRRLTALRGPAATHVTFNGELQIHRATTARVALHARWEETVDQPGEPAPVARQSEVVVVDMPLPGADERLTSDLVTDFPISAGGSVVARYQPDTDRLVFNSAATPKHLFGDRKRRKVRYRAAGASRFREFFPSTAPGGFTRESDEFVIDIPSTARPAAPRVLYALPTFNWQRSTDTNLIASARFGSGVRVYLDRPWFSSGEGELLGVIMAQGTFDDAQRELMRPFVSDAGNDPVVMGGADALLQSSSFGFGHPTDSNLSLEGAPQLVTAIGFPVAFDPDRKLWYSDIRIELDGFSTQASGAFVRLSLARYQPNALSGCELSRSVLVDFVQMAGDRSAIATFDPYDPAVVRLAVAGETLRSKANAVGVPQNDFTSIEVGVETRRPHVAGELGWMPAPPSLATIQEELVSGTLNAIWTGRITLPADRKRGDFRLVIREFERWLDDASVAAGGSNPAERARRLIYAETLEV